MRPPIFKILIVLIVILSAAQIRAQEKLKGNKIVVTEDRAIYDFNKIAVNDNIDLILTQGRESSVSIETDENLQAAVITEIRDSTLIISLAQKISRKKALIAHVTVDGNFNELTSKDKADVEGSGSLNLNGSFILNAEGNSKVTLTFQSGAFYLNNNESANLNLNVKSGEAYLRSNKTGRAKINISANSIEIIGQGSSVMDVQGTSEECQFKAENRSTIRAEELESNEAVVSASDNSNINVNATKDLWITAIDNSEINIYNNPVITIDKFADKAVLRKK